MITITEWNYFFATAAGAAAALLGLIFVGVSVNLNKILVSQTLPVRALMSITFLFNILVQALLLLIPKQHEVSLGVEISVTSFFILLSIEVMEVYILKKIEKPHRKKQIIGFILSQIALVPFIFCSASILTHTTGAVYWIVPGIIFSFFKSLIDAWVLLIEINR